MDITVNSQSNTVAPKQAECKKMRYSIRKVATVGATSALVGTLAFLGATQVKADQVTETAPAVATATATPETSTPIRIFHCILRRIVSCLIFLTFFIYITLALHKYICAYIKIK